MRSPSSVRSVISAPGILLRAAGLIAVGSMVPSQGASKRDQQHDQQDDDAAER